jgi:cellulose biosynthesis protein BcsQ
MKVLAVGSAKGGVGKSTTVLYLATRAAEALGGTRENPAVCILDRDESKNLTRLLARLPDRVRPGVVVVPGDELPPESAGLPLCIIDTPPGLSAVRSLREAQLIVAPVRTELQSIINMAEYLRMLETQRLVVSPGMRLLALLPTMVQRRVSDRQRLADIRAIATHQHPPLLVLPPVADREDVKLYRLDSPEYDAIAKEVLARAEIATFTH